MESYDKIIWICCSLSIAGSLLLITVYALSQKLRQMGAQFVLSQAICDLLLSCALLLGPIFKDAGFTEAETVHGITIATWNCNLVGFLVQFSNQASVAWNFMMSIAIYRTVYAATKYKSNPKSFLYYHAYVWIFSFGNAFTLLFSKQYSANTVGCWIKDPLFYLFFVLPLLVYFFGCSVVLLLVVNRVVKVTTRLSKSSRSEEYAFMIQVIKYIVVFIVMWAVPLGVGFLKILHVQVPRGMEIAILFSLSLQGFASACVWLTSPRFLRMCVEYHRRRLSGYRTLTGTDDSEKYINTNANVREREQTTEESERLCNGVAQVEAPQI
jgi:hypothetical protein